MPPATLLTSSTFTPYRFRVDELWPAPNADGDGGGGGGGGSEGEGSQRIHGRIYRTGTLRSTLRCTLRGVR